MVYLLSFGLLWFLSCWWLCNLDCEYILICSVHWSSIGKLKFKSFFFILGANCGRLCFYIELNPTKKKFPSTPPEGDLVIEWEKTQKRNQEKENQGTSSNTYFFISRIMKLLPYRVTKCNFLYTMQILGKMVSPQKWVILGKKYIYDQAG